MGMESVVETYENIHILKRLSVREYLMESRVYFRPKKDAGTFILTRFAGFTPFKFNPIDSRHSCRRRGWSYTHWKNKFIPLFIVIFTWVIPLWWRCIRCVVDIRQSRILHFPFHALWFNFYKNYLWLTDIKCYFNIDWSPPVVSIWRYNKFYFLKLKTRHKEMSRSY
jgi:hypothetical protein